MKTLLLLFALAYPLNGQIAPPTQRTVPVNDNSGLVMDIYKQTNQQSAQLSSLTSDVRSMKESLDRIERAEQDTNTKFETLRHDVDKQGVIANFFVYSAQTGATILLALFVSVPGTFVIQRLLADRFANNASKSATGGPQ